MLVVVIDFTNGMSEMLLLCAEMVAAHRPCFSAAELLFDDLSNLLLSSSACQRNATVKLYKLAYLTDLWI